MFHLQATTEFQKWVQGMRDLRAKVAVLRRLGRMQVGNFGDFKPVGEGVPADIKRAHLLAREL